MKNKLKFKSLPIHSKTKGVKQAAEGNHVIEGVVIVQAGIDKCGDNLTKEFVDGIVKQGNDQPQGIKSRFGHPSMCSTTLGTYIGRYKNFSAIDDADGKYKATADLHLDPIAKTAPKGDLYTYTIQMAEKNPDMFGNSIVFQGRYKPELDDKGSPKKDSEGYTIYSDELELVLFEASDVVDSPAATDNLFKDDEDLGVILTDFLDENPQVFKAFEKNPAIIQDFVERYNSYKSKQTSMKPEEKKEQDKKVSKLKQAVNILKGLFKKSIDVPLADGRIMVVDTNNTEPATGDAVSIDGSPAPDGEYPTADKKTIKVADGVITEIVGATADPIEGEEEQKEIIKLREQLKQKENLIGSLKNKLKEAGSLEVKVKERLQEIEGLLPEIASDGEPTEEEGNRQKPKAASKGRDAMWDRMNKKKSADADSEEEEED